ncbi:hypothetical protein [Micromonospora sp. CPCC 206061]|uniref:hypothetical protein n=1 Tax=Micromonospora sp. CPCC 206061 TaxID=3122410 RepID=UPI002FF0D672
MTMLKANRLARGLTVDQAVAALHAVYEQATQQQCRLTREQLTHFESGGRPSSRYQDVFCRFYRTGPVQMGWAVDYSAQPVTDAAPAMWLTPSCAGPVDDSLENGVHAAKEATMLRRSLLRTTATAGILLPVAILDEADGIRARMDRALDSGSLTDGDLDRWGQTVQERGHAFKTMPAREVLIEVIADFAELLTHAGHHQPTAVQARLCGLSSRLAGIAGNVLTDIGDVRAGGRWFATAVRAADQAGDRSLHAWVLARQATVGLYLGQSAETAISRAVEAQRRAGRVRCSGAVLAAATEARAWARLGHAAAARNALGRARTIAEGLPEADRANSIFGYPHRQLSFHVASTLTLVGSVREAERATREALSQYPAGEYVNPALICLDKAACIMRAGDPAAGHRHALQTLTAVPTQYRTALVLSRARELATVALDAGEASQRRARDFTAAVNALEHAATGT